LGTVKDLARLLSTVRTVGLDSMAFVYHFEGHSTYGPLTRALFSRIEDGSLSACTSVLTLCEVLTGARKAGDAGLVQVYQQVFELMPNLSVVAIDSPCAALAATLRLEAGLRTPDALQVATAIRWGAEAFITNDGRLRHVAQIKVIVLSDYA